ncbi:MAG: lipopolysaccharide kinase InaA family protein, partial [Planctomycetia bacterium]
GVGDSQFSDSSYGRAFDDGAERSARLVGAVVPNATPAEAQHVFWLRDTLWVVHGNQRRKLFDQHGLRLDQWKQQGRATLVKTGAGRTIYRVRLPDLDLYVKHFQSTSLFNFLHQLVRRDRAEKEFELAGLLEQCGVPTIQPIALGERRRRGVLIDSYLLTKAIPDALTLYELIERCVMNGRSPLPASMRFQLTDALAQLTATIHDRGLEHRDLHEKNIMVQPQADGRFRLFLLDLHELRVHWRLSWPAARRELARMGRYFTLRTTATDRFRFFRRYAELRGFSRAEAHDLARDVEKQVVASRADFWRRRDTRRPNKSQRIRHYKMPGVEAFASPDLPAEIVEQLMKQPEQPFLNSVVRYWKNGRNTRVAEVALPQILNGRTLTYKQYYFKGWHESLAALVRKN